MGPLVLEDHRQLQQRVLERVRLPERLEGWAAGRGQPWEMISGATVHKYCWNRFSGFRTILGKDFRWFQLRYAISETINDPPTDPLTHSLTSKKYHTSRLPAQLWALHSVFGSGGGHWCFLKYFSWLFNLTWIGHRCFLKYVSWLLNSTWIGHRCFLKYFSWLFNLTWIGHINSTQLSYLTERTKVFKLPQWHR